MRVGQRAGRTPVCTVFYLGNGCADAGPLLPAMRAGKACRAAITAALHAFVIISPG